MLSCLRGTGGAPGGHGIGIGLLIAAVTLLFVLLDAAAAENGPEGVAAPIRQLDLAPMTAVRLQRQNVAAACSAKEDGMLVLTARPALCLCDGDKGQWEDITTGRACAWTKP